MIIKIDHLTYITNDIEYDDNILKTLGYNIEFYEENLINPKNKYEFMKYKQLEYSMALYLKNQSYNIELIRYPKVLKDEFNLNKLSVKSKNTTKYISELSSMLNFKLQGPFDELIIYVSNFNESIKFWNILGFKQTKTGNNYVRLTFSTWNGDKYHVILNRMKELSCINSYLECLGFNNVAVISTSIEQERNKLIENEFNCTKIEIVRINRKNLKIFFVKGPSNEIVEIIGLL